MNKEREMIDREGLIQFTKELIRIPSVFDEEKGIHEEEVALFVAEKLKEMGLVVHIEYVSEGRPNIIAILEGEGPGKTLILEAHTDVVTPGDPKEWAYPPFGAVEENGRIYGRGACDTKGNLAAAIYALKTIIDSKSSFKGRILLAIPVDEEGMMLGIKRFIQKGWADGVDGAIICEPEENQICIAQKGAMRGKFTVFGKMAHGAMPLAGINPNWGMARVIQGLQQLEREEIERLGEHDFLGFPSITPTVVMAPARGEAQLNVIPKEALCYIDIRTVPGQEEEEIIGRIQSLLRDLKIKEKDFKAELEIFERRPCTETPIEDPLVQSMCFAYRKVTGREPIFNGVPGATDGTFLSAWKGIPIVTTGAGDRLIPHQIDEWVEIEELVETTAIYVTAILDYLT